MRIQLININASCYRVTYNNVRIGEIERQDDGYYAFYFDQSRTGFWEEWLLREIADELKRMNADWDAQIHAIVGDSK